MINQELSESQKVRKNKTILTIDKINDRLWKSRFDDSETVEKEAHKNLSLAEECSYDSGAAYAKLNIAAAAFLQSKNDTALKYLNEASHWFSDKKSEAGYVKAVLLRGNIFESFGDYEKTLSLWLEACKASEKLNDSELIGESSNQLGLIYSRLCDFNKALEYFNKALVIREKSGDENGMASSLNRIGMVLRRKNNYQELLEYYFRSLEIRGKNRQTNAIPWTLLGIANTYEDMRLYNEALKYYAKGSVGSDRRCSLQCLLGEGRIYSRSGETARAELSLKKSLMMARELKSLVLEADALSSLADHYESSGQPDDALKYFRQFLKVRDLYQGDESRNRLSNIEVAHAIEKSEHEKEIFRLRHVELKQAYDIIEEKNKDITASINYASRIQKALLPDPGDIRGLTRRSFILYLPKDIVSGDFYWFSKIKGNLIIAAGDCTGHGVPGALMSMLGISFLEEIVNKRGVTSTGKILSELRMEIKRALHHKTSGNETKDGMDLSLCIFDFRNNKIQYSGAFNSMYLVRDKILTEYRADRMPIGYHDYSGVEFTQNEIKSERDDMIFLFSDGFADQFGGPFNKKYKYSAFKELLARYSDLPPGKQKLKLEDEFLKWKGSNPQIDDVLIIGIKI